jgi:hypothetical protein
MRRTLIGIVFLTSTITLWAQTPSANNEQREVERIKSFPVSSIDSTLPEVSLEYFLNYEADGAPINWEVNDCGEQSGNPSDEKREIPACVQAEVFLKNHRTLTVLVVYGTSKKKLDVPAVWSITIEDANGEVRVVRQLRDLPMELHRPMPEMPKDSPSTVGDSLRAPQRDKC